MAKRYHMSSVKNKGGGKYGSHDKSYQMPHENSGHNLHNHVEGVGPEYYSGAAARHKMEKKDEGMIFEDHRAVANLPQEVMIKPWPMAPGYLPEALDDTIAGVDSQLSYDNARKMGAYEPKKV